MERMTLRRIRQAFAVGYSALPRISRRYWVVIVAIASALVVAGGARAAPFDEDFTFPLPGGQSITLYGQGDDFSAVFETLDGYTVVYDAPSRFYHYAVVGDDGRLRSSGLIAGIADPAAAGLARHIRGDTAVVSADRQERRQEWEAGTGIPQRWEALKARHRTIEAARRGGDIVMSPPPLPTVGHRVGLTLLVDFSDQVGTIPLSNIDSFLNGDNYTGYGNNGSVKSYYHDVSAGLLTYTNVAVGYVRMPKTKAYYDDPTKDDLQMGRELVQDAIVALQAMPGFDTTIRPLLDTLTTNEANEVLACNVFYAGTCASPWAMGLWPSNDTLVAPVELWPGGKKALLYQMTNMGSSLELGTFCHENGHMLCGFPDVYDYDYDSTGGAGYFCLMNSGGHGTNPSQICAYLKLVAGWATTVTDLPSSAQSFTLPAAGSASGNVFLRTLNPMAPDTEFFLIENRRQSGRDASLPTSGLAIWHVDELGDHDDQRIAWNTLHQNYEVSLEQADNLFHFQNNVNRGDSRDLFYLGNAASGYANRFDDTTGPSARWWSGANSNLHVLNISAVGASMTLTAYAVATPATTIYVSADGNDANNGSSWAAAKRTVQAGLNAALMGAQVWVKAGTYAEQITLKSGVALYGGLAGGETSLSQRNWRANVTILDGGHAGTVVTAASLVSAARIDGFTIRNGSGTDGGGVKVTNSSSWLTIANNTIVSNTASSAGGGLYMNSSSPTIADSAITGNSASSGGGLYLSSSTATISNNTITSNSATSGGGLYLLDSSPTVAGTIVAFNSSGICATGSGTVSARYNCVYGNTAYNYSGLTDPSGTNGNISGDPGFVVTPTTGPDGQWATSDDGFGNLHLAAGSPCINAGDPAYVPATVETDLDGRPRKIGTSVDIGACEFAWTGDINLDGYVNVADLQALVAAWASQPGPPASSNWNPNADINNDGYVNVGDLQLLVANWGKSL